MCRKPPRGQRGYAILIAMIILVMGSIYTLVSQLEVVSRNYARQEAALNTLDQAKEALLGYAATYRDQHANDVFGYLPCPDTAGDGTAAATCGNAGEAAIGLLPFKTLGLPDLRDTESICLWYAVAGRFKNSPQGTAYNATTNPTSQPLNWDTQGQFSIVGTTVAPDSGDGGAAAVIFATGAPIGTQSRGPGGSAPCNIDPAQVSAYLDGNNAFSAVAGLDKTAGIAITPGIVKDGSGNITVNDQVTWITPRAMFDRIVKRADVGNALAATPAGQINKAIDGIRAVLDKRIQDDIVAGGTPGSWSKPANSVSSTPYHVGELQPTSTAGVLNADRLNYDKSSLQRSSLSATYDNYVDNWSEPFRMATCANLDAPCLDIGNGGTANCRGALLFGGRRSDGLPRPSTEKTVSASCNWQCVLGKYFENNGALSLLASGSASFSGNRAYDNASATSRAVDVAACLGQGTFASLQRNADLFNQGIVRVGGGSNPLATVTGIGGASPTISLGSSTASSSAGCVWYPTALPVGGSLRAYFSYRIVSASSTARGFTLAIADAATNNPAFVNPVMCGASGSTRMGYAGAPTTGIVTKSDGSTLGIASLSWSPSTGLASVTTASSHGLAAGNLVTISGAYPTGYNYTNAVVSSVSGTTIFRYAIPNPGQPNAGIAPPKLGLEFDTNVDASRSDPSAEHLAQLFWGSVGDNNPLTSTTIRDGGDDNYHGNGVTGDGSQPKNPRNLSPIAATVTPVATIAAAQWAGGVATVTTAGSHGLSAGDRFVVSDATTLGYKGTYTVATAPTATQLTHALAGDPGPYPRIAAVASATWSLGTAIVTTTAAHGLTDGQGIVLANASPSAWNGAYTISVLDATRFTIALAANPGTYLSGGLVLNPVTTVSNAVWSGSSVVAISGASWLANTATVTTTFAHGLTTGTYVTIASATPTAWNGTYPVVVLGPTQFSFTRTVDPGGYVSGGTVSSIGSVTATTAAAHGLVSGQYVTLAGISPTAFNGTYQIAVTDATHFVYVPNTIPGAYVSGGRVAVAPMSSTIMRGAATNITNAAWSSSGTVTITSAGHGLSTGQTVYISGMNPSGYDGMYMVSTVTSSSQFTYSKRDNPGGFVAGGVVAVAAPTTSTIAAATWSSASGGTATATTTAAHGLATGQVVNIDSVSPAGFNGAHAIAVTGATTFTYALPTDPGGNFSGTSFDTPGIASVKTTDVFLPYSTMPLATDIHVRVDLTRGYDSSRRQATVSMQAYVGDTFDISGNCLLSDFKNLALDLTALCPSRTPSVAQNGIVINDLAGPALANVFLGFTTARGSSSNDNQDIQIQNLILRSQ